MADRYLPKNTPTPLLDRIVFWVLCVVLLAGICAWAYGSTHPA